jgi:folate-binding protein YgfZ
MKDIDSYEAALKTTAYFQQPLAGFLRLAGRDRFDFIQRQSTNDLRLLTADRIISTVLTSPTARILDLFCVIDEGESLGVVTLAARHTETLKFLRSRIFFSDQVSIDDFSADIAQILLFGPQTDSVLEELGLQPPAPDHITQWEIANQLVTVIGQKVLANNGYRFLAPISCMDALLGTLKDAGVNSLDSETFESLRVEAGQPGPIGELVDDYNPLEVGLQEMISDSKGCYTGQEVIARQITYDKVSKKLVGIRLSNLLAAGAEIKVDGKTVGRLTSVAQSLRFGPIGLAVVRRQYGEAGRAISVFGESDSSTIGEVVALPFQ